MAAPDHILDYLQQVERLADDCLTTKQHIIELNKQKNMNREALAVLIKGEKQTHPVRSKDKVWVNVGGMFLKMKKVGVGFCLPF